jgi:hypothetical protein
MMFSLKLPWSNRLHAIRAHTCTHSTPFIRWYSPLTTDNERKDCCLGRAVCTTKAKEELRTHCSTWKLLKSASTSISPQKHRWHFCCEQQMKLSKILTFLTRFPKLRNLSAEFGFCWHCNWPSVVWTIQTRALRVEEELSPTRDCFRISPQRFKGPKLAVRRTVILLFFYFWKPSIHSSIFCEANTCFTEMSWQRHTTRCSCLDVLMTWWLVLMSWCLDDLRTCLDVLMSWWLCCLFDHRLVSSQTSLLSYTFLHQCIIT